MASQHDSNSSVASPYTYINVTILWDAEPVSIRPLNDLETQPINLMW